MKPLILLTLCTLSALAQAPANPPAAPPANPPVVAPGNPSAPAPDKPAAQPPAAPAVSAPKPAVNIPPETIVATIEGKAWTRAEFDALLRNLPPDSQRNFKANKEGWLDQFALMNRLAKLAKEDGVDQREPFRQQLEYSILQFLAQSYIDVRAASPTLTDEEIGKWFEAHKNEYKRARVLGIQVAWGGIPKEGEKARTDKEAQALVDDILKRAKDGESFAELAKKYSDDVRSKAKGGEFPLVRPEDASLNREIKSAIFTTKVGELTRVVRLPARLYIFKVLEFVDPAQQELRSEIVNKIGQEQLIQWMDKTRKEVKAEINAPAYFGLPEKK
ncbi:MAG: peptidylprolyl isomerase [Bryobacteraceae bacterium]|jgi:hypothetical protein